MDITWKCLLEYLVDLYLVVLFYGNFFSNLFSIPLIAYLNIGRFDEPLKWTYGMSEE